MQADVTVSWGLGIKPVSLTLTTLRKIPKDMK